MKKNSQPNKKDLKNDLEGQNKIVDSNEIASKTDEKENLDTIEELKISIKTLEESNKKYQDEWLRAKAETENMKKRTQLDISNAYKYSIETIVKNLLPVKDSLEASLKTNDKNNLDTVKEGVKLTLRELESVFEKNKIDEINPIDEKLDPNFHQAMTTVKSEKPPNTIVEVLQKGYTLNERLIRPALVSVSKNKDT